MTLPKRAGPNRGLLLTAALSLLATVAPVGLPNSHRWMDTLENAVHGFVFAVITLATLDWLRSHSRLQPWSPQRRYWTALGVAAAFGALTEVLQIPGPRSASVDDFILDICGSLMALSWWSLRQLPRQLSMASARHLLIMAAALVTFCLPLAEAALAYRQRTAGLPALLTFETSWSTYFVSGDSQRERQELPPQWRKHPGEMALKADLPHTQWPRVNLVEPYPDWSRYSSISFDLVNPMSEALELTLRIEDAAHDGRYEDRFNKVITIPPGRRETFTIDLESLANAPAGRKMDLRHMARLSIYRDEPAAAGTFYLVGLRLQ